MIWEMAAARLSAERDPAASRPSFPNALYVNTDMADVPIRLNGYLP
jgi:hypothetical protein